jgi:predicted Zn finger-like uncharacterized protein
MSLATRCNSCGTVFRVVQDQLKVSEGWVRCGRCNEVFNALEGLFDLQRESPADVPPPPAPRPAAAPSPEAQEESPEYDDDPSLVDKIDAQLLSPRRSAFGGLAGLSPSDRRHADFADARFDTDLPPEGSSDLSIGPDPTEPEGMLEAGPTPQFVREAESQERWRGSNARAALLVACLALTLALAVQAGHQFRDRIAVQWPATQPALVAWCQWVACTIEAPRRIEEVSVESSSLTRAAGTADAFQLSVLLRNRASVPLAVPWIDLSLTDAAGQLVARRALGPRDFGVGASSLPVGSELPMQLTLSGGPGRIAGYTVEIFYP